MILPKQVNLAELAYLMHQADEELERQARVIKARELFAGYIDADLAETAADILIGADETDIEAINLMAIAINTTVRRISLTGFEVSTPTAEDGSTQTIDETTLQPITAWIKKLYEVNRLETISRDLHRNTERDGEAFLLLDYDPEYLFPRDPSQVGIVKFYIHERYTDAGTVWKTFQGSSEGCKAHYRNDDPNQNLDMVSKRWVEQYYEDEEIKARQRMTLYIAEQGSPEVGDLLSARIEKYALGDSGEWEQYKDEQDPEWPIWWTEGLSEGSPSLPLPVIHFRNEEYEPGHKKIWGLQTSMDQLWISFMNAQLLTGHQLLVALGFHPTTDGQPPAEDGSNLMQVNPRQILGTAAKTPREASLTAIPPAPAEPLLQGLDKTAIYASFVGSLPVSNFIFSKAVASSETLKQGDAELVARVNELLGLWTFSWSQVMDVARKLANNFGKANMEETPAIVPQWAPAERRDMNHLTKEADAKRDAGVPEFIILQEIWGYTPEQAADYLRLNVQEHQQGIGPEVTQAPEGATTNGQETAQPKANSDGADGRPTGQDHGNAGEQQVSSFSS